MHKYLLILLLIFSFHFRIECQDSYFSQFFNSILYLNPAYAGSAHQPRISVAYRNQMPALGSPWVSYNASYDMPVKVLQGGVGVNVLNDAQGPALNRLSIDVMYSYFLEVSSLLTVNAGFQASYSHRFLRGSELILPDQVSAYGFQGNSRESIGNTNKGYPDFAVGFVAFTQNAYAGVSMHHLTRPDMSMFKTSGEPLSRKLTVHGGMYLSVCQKRLGREALKLNPNLVYLHQGGFRQINYGLDVICNNTVYTGAWFRHSMDFAMNAFVVHIGYDHECFRFGYSHDFNVYNPWRTMQNMGSHELTFLIKLESGRRSRGRFRTIKSPKI